MKTLAESNIDYLFCKLVILKHTINMHKYKLIFQVNK